MLVGTDRDLLPPIGAFLLNCALPGALGARYTSARLSLVRAAPVASSGGPCGAGSSCWLGSAFNRVRSVSKRAEMLGRRGRATDPACGVVGDSDMVDSCVGYDEIEDVLWVWSSGGFGNTARPSLLGVDISKARAKGEVCTRRGGVLKLELGLLWVPTVDSMGCRGMLQ